MISPKSLDVKSLVPIGLLASIALLMAAQRADAATVLYSQPAQSPVVSTRASQTQTGLGLVFQTFDSFALATGAFITEVEWQGSYFNALVADNTFNPPANSTGFTLEFYADSAGAPGALLSSQFFSPAAASETFVAQQAFSPTLGLGIYDYSAVLGTPFFANGGSTYWLSVYAQSPAASPTQAQWGWNGGTGGDGTSMQAILPAPPTLVNFDRAMTLTGTQVPEPSSLLLLGAGLAALAVPMKRKKNN